MKVTVTQQVQVVHDGVVYRPGDTAEIPDAVAEHWLRSGWVTEVSAPAPKKAAPRKAPASK